MVKNISDNFEEICVHYYSLGDGITRTSTDMEIDAAHAEIKGNIHVMN